MADTPYQFPPPRRLTFGTTAAAINFRRGALADERSSYLEEWQDIADYFRIRRTRAQGSTSDARKRNRSKKSLNERGIFASRTAGAGMLSGVSSPSRPWLKLGTGDDALNEYQSVRLWLDDTQKKLYRAFSGSNYYQAKQTSYRDQADFGQGPMLIDEDYEDAINCYVSPAGEYYISVNYKGTVDTLYRDLEKTTLQVMQRFRGNVPEEVKRDYDTGRYDTMWKLVHAVEPNIRRIKGQAGPLGMPYQSVYWFEGLSDLNDNSIAEVKGYHECPISSPRWDVQSNDVYGDGCGALALPGNKSLQALEKSKGKIVDKLGEPALQAPSSMKSETISHVRGSVSYYPTSNGNQNPIAPLYITDPQALPAIREEGNEIGDRIDKSYYVDLFLATIDSDRRMVTAAEIAERHEEKLIALGPTLERSHYEGLDVDVKRTFAILARNGVLRRPPPEMNGVPLKIEYVSILATAQRAIGLSGIERFAGFIGNISATSPEVMDKWDKDQTVDEYADMSGVPASIVRSDEQVRAMREQRNKQAQQQEQMAQLQQGAEAAKVASQADTGRNSNLLADIIGNQGRIV